MTDYSELLNEKRIKQGDFSEEQVRECFNIARRDIRTSKIIKQENQDWAYNIAYNAMLQAARGLMFSAGYRPAGEAQHVTVIKFAELTLEKEFRETLNIMDSMRRKRNRTVYDVSGLVSETEVKEAIKAAEEFVNKLEKKLK